MSSTILQAYLRLNLLDLGGDDSRLQKLQSAASEVAKELAEIPADGLPIFLAALSFDQYADDVFTKIADAIEKHWTTYHGAFQGPSAATLYRAVALQSIVEAIEMQPVLGTAISLLMRNFGPYLEIGKHKPSIDILVGAADAAFDEECEESMLRPSEIAFGVPKASKPPTFDRPALQKRIDAAVGPNNRAGQAGENPNPQWTNSGGPWSHDFSDRLTALLADSLDNALKKASEMDLKCIEVLNNNFNELARQSDTQVTSATSLLWWRQALYSASAGKPYRELPPIDALIHSVIDLSQLIPAAYERALESFLMETVLLLLPPQPELKVNDFLKASPFALSSLSESAALQPPIGLLVAAIAKNYDDGGIAQVSLPPHKWAVWLLRELKSLQALGEPAPLAEQGGRSE